MIRSTFKRYFFLLSFSAGEIFSQVPENLLLDGLQPPSSELKQEVGPYLEFRTAGFSSWHPKQRQMLILTRFADVSQVHRVEFPGGARTQLTFASEPVRGAAFRPRSGNDFVFSQDVGGSEFFQYYRFDLISSEIELITDGKSRNTGALWSRNGEWLAYHSTRRNGKDADIYLVRPESPGSNRLVAEMNGGGWQVTDWSRDGKRLLVSEYISANESRIHLLETATGEMKLVSPQKNEKVSFSGAQFGGDEKFIYFTTDLDAEFHRLTQMELASGRLVPLTRDIPWDVEEFEVSPDGKHIAFITNEDGVGVLHLLDASLGKPIKAPEIPTGIPGGLKWHENGRDLAFTHSSAQSPSDAYSVDIKTGALERWTRSETGGLDAEKFSKPELVHLQGFDRLKFSAFVYRPASSKFPGKRPVLINIHGGPEGQSRPGFLGRNNFFIEEMGLIVIYPNVRGSSGYGKTFLQLDNGFQREDSVKDIGALLDWIQEQPDMDASKVVVMGGSYGGYMVLASLVHYSPRLLAGIDIVGISNFITFLQNTQDYRRDLRRVEYGDERDPQMREFLKKISPANHAEKIKKPLLVIQGKNDPRVPESESEQMVAAIRENGGKVSYLMAKDEGHGFAKKKNADFMFLTIIQFLQDLL